MPTVPDIEEVQRASLQALERCIRNGDCIAFLGSGPSHCYPPWHELILKLCEACGVAAPTLERLTDAESLRSAASECRRRDERSYCRVLFDEFGPPEPEIPTVHILLGKIGFRSYVTTCFDPLMSKALALNGKSVQIYRPPSLPYKAIGPNGLLHIHGCVERDRVPNSGELILGNEDFERVYKDTNATLRSFLLQLLEYDSCCFIGCGFREAELQEIFKICREIRQRIARESADLPAQQLFAVVPTYWRTDSTSDGDSSTQDTSKASPARDMERESSEDQWFRELGITTVRYDALDESHTGLRRFLSQFADLPTPQFKVLPPERPS